ncbi:MAG: hypothetical protein KBT88_03230 [Gammaproteobacteria bacterium]|nr:hypothetical protein [Gammaproteobacteria bacterium]MBQ0838772.1 hypothetical protein [Gammaproteobacteria bacterium]
MGAIDFALIKKQAMLFLVIFGLGIVLVGGSYLFQQSQFDDKRGLEKRMNSTRAENSRILQDIELLNTYRADYAALVKRGFFNAEHRLTWIEQLEVTSSALEISDLHYKISAQQAVGEERFATPYGISLQQSLFTFQSSLLHEGDLLDLVAGLKSLNSGLFVLEHCQLARINDVAEKSSRNNFKASCDVSWYTSGSVAAPALPQRDKI